jgi:hypothetical protein
MTLPRTLLRLAVLPGTLALGLLAAACGNPLFSPCSGQLDCGEGLRCVDLGNNQRLCTRPCSVVKKAAGLPDGFDNDALFEDGGTAQQDIADPACGDDTISLISQDNPDERGQNISVESNGVVGVCRVSPEQLANNDIASDSVLSGFCAPL